MSREVIARLAKQSAIPGLVALSYAAWQHWPLTLATRLPELVASFGAAFFLASWFSGQVLRTSKQVHDEQRFNSILERIDQSDNKKFEGVKLAMADSIDAQADLASLQVTVKLMVPEYIRAMVYATHLDHGDEPKAPFVMPWSVSDEALAKARDMLRDAEARRSK